MQTPIATIVRHQGQFRTRVNGELLNAFRHNYADMLADNLRWFGFIVRFEI